VSIVRVSGPEALRVADRVFQGSGPLPSRHAGGGLLYGKVLDSEGPVDEVLLLVMRAPHSYTTEDTVEIQGHGGRMSPRRLLRTVLGAGARVAEPGEFTRRAFLNGRIDLLQAEAVLDLVRAQSDRSAAAALEQLEGGLSSPFNRLYDELLSATSELEATLDFSEEDLPPPLIPMIVERVRSAAARAQCLSETWGEGHLLREGALAVISGRTNVGKSTLLNALLESDRAIVSEQPGTTRDSIEETMVLDGIPLRLVDTAGLRDTDCLVEQAGIQRTQWHLNRADIHLHLLDASRTLSDEDRRLLDRLPADRSILILNKTDLGCRSRPEDLPLKPCLPASLVQGEGLAEIREALREHLEKQTDSSSRPHAVVSERHRRLLADAGEEMLQACAQLGAEGEADHSVEAASHLRNALEYLGQATGRIYEEEVLNTIFSRFCVGK